VRGDRVMPDGQNADVAYSAISPRFILHTNWLAREYVVLNYTRYFLGPNVRPSPPYSQLYNSSGQPLPLEAPLSTVTKPDENLISLTAMLAF
jgi:hypothetical protein